VEQHACLQLLLVAPPARAALLFCLIAVHDPSDPSLVIRLAARYMLTTTFLLAQRLGARASTARTSDVKSTCGLGAKSSGGRSDVLR
jgi:hypothetical protein